MVVEVVSVNVVLDVLVLVTVEVFVVVEPECVVVLVVLVVVEPEWVVVDVLTVVLLVRVLDVDEIDVPVVVDPVCVVVVVLTVVVVVAVPVVVEPECVVVLMVAVEVVVLVVVEPECVVVVGVVLVMQSVQCSQTSHVHFSDQSTFAAVLVQKSAHSGAYSLDSWAPALGPHSSQPRQADLRKLSASHMRALDIREHQAAHAGLEFDVVVDTVVVDPV